MARSEAAELRHIAFEVDDVSLRIDILRDRNVYVEKIRIDETTNKRFTFIFDPDNLPIGLYEK